MSITGSRRLRWASFALVLTLLSFTARAQEYTGAVVVTVTADRPTATYRVGEPVTFLIRVTRDGAPVSATASYAIGPDGFPLGFPATIEAAKPVPPEGLSVLGGTLKQPGLLRNIVTTVVAGRTYRGLATVAFSPEAIVATVSEPADFDAFWEAGKAALARIPMDARLTPLPDSSTSKADVYHIELKTVGIAAPAASKIYGILCEPKAGTQLPALLSVPGAGVRPYAGLIDLCEKGLITLQIGIHGIPVTLDQSLYDDLRYGALYDYNTFNLDDRERYYFHRVYLSCLRANDLLASRPRWDGKNLAVTGGSQGGGLAIVTAALDSRVKGLAVSYPALADMTGYLHGRAGGWPHLFRADKKRVHETPAKMATVPYYDVVNFAKRLRVPGIYTWGFNDEVVTPTSMFAAYNAITAPKRLLLALETGHRRTAEQEDTMNGWLETLLRGEQPPMTSTLSARPQ
jgi:cephalosporin-C deacetylase-like acetyl esterase